MGDRAQCVHYPGLESGCSSQCSAVEVKSWFSSRQHWNSVTKGKARSKLEPGVTITGWPAGAKLACFRCTECRGMCQSKGIPLGNRNPEDYDYMKHCVASTYNFISNILICAISLEDAAAWMSSEYLSLYEKVFYFYSHNYATQDSEVQAYAFISIRLAILNLKKKPKSWNTWRYFKQRESLKEMSVRILPLTLALQSPSLTDSGMQPQALKWGDIEMKQLFKATQRGSLGCRMQDGSENWLKWLNSLHFSRALEAAKCQTTSAKSP